MFVFVAGTHVLVYYTVILHYWPTQYYNIDILYRHAQYKPVFCNLSINEISVNFLCCEN